MATARLWPSFIRSCALLGIVLLFWIDSKELGNLMRLSWQYEHESTSGVASFVSFRSSLHSPSIDIIPSLENELLDDDLSLRAASDTDWDASEDSTLETWPTPESLISGNTSQLTNGTKRPAFGTNAASNGWPTLDSLIDRANPRIKADVQFMLDFAILAHPKTATSSTMSWLNSHDEILMHNHELNSLSRGRPAEFVSQLYNLPSGRQYKRGYKEPRDLFSGPALTAIAQHWPRTKLIVGLRHPVLWFQSFYNFRVQRGYKMPPAESLMGRATRPMHGVSTDEAKFHQHLDHLGKTARLGAELQLLAYGNKERRPLRKMKNPVFLYEINQLRDLNETRLVLFRSDLQHFLDLKSNLDPIPLQKGNGTAAATVTGKSRTIDICAPKLQMVRAELMKHARAASTWIRLYFLKSADVTVSSPSYFDELLKSWTIDPCQSS